MRLKLTTSRLLAYPDGTPGPVQQIGDVIEVDDAEGCRMLAAKQAEPVGAVVETAVASQPREAATLPRPAKR